MCTPLAVGPVPAIAPAEAAQRGGVGVVRSRNPMNDIEGRLAKELMIDDIWLRYAMFGPDQSTWMVRENKELLIREVLGGLPEDQPFTVRMVSMETRLKQGQRIYRHELEANFGMAIPKER